MKKVLIAVGALAVVLALGALTVAFVAAHRYPEREAGPAAASAPANTPAAAARDGEAQQGFLYGRVTSDAGVTYEGRLRFGGDQEAFWGDYFNGVKRENPWVAQVPPEKLPKERHRLEIFGFEIARRERKKELRRLFMARFGDIARVEPHGRDVQVTLKSGTVFDLNRFDASDFDDGVRVWDVQQGVVDLDSGQIRSIELLPTAPLAAVPTRLHGTVHTRQGEFTGFVQWDRNDCVGSDELSGHTAEGDLSPRFDTIRSIARHSGDSSLVTLLDGREVVLSGRREVGSGNLGIYVDDRRYGRVLVSWDAFERVEFSPGGSGPAYGDFPPGAPLTGSVTTRDGRRLAGRLVYDLDESETTHTLDASSEGVDYTVPFGLIASIVKPVPEKDDDRPARVTLQDGEELRLERTGDLGEGNAGLLIFVDGGLRPEYVPWSDVQQVDFARPPAMYPPLGGS